jgi:hypothetical protein
MHPNAAADAHRYAEVVNIHIVTGVLSMVGSALLLYACIRDKQLREHPGCVAADTVACLPGRPPWGLVHASGRARWSHTSCVV